MKVLSKTIHDYKKWLLFNNGLSEYKNLYALYNAVNDSKHVNGSNCQQLQEDGAIKYLITNSSASNELVINEEDRLQLLAYLRQHYFQTDHIDEWFKEKESQVDRLSNHTYLPNQELVFNESPVTDVKPHEKEVKYYTMKLVFSIIGYLFLALALTVAFLESPAQAVMYSVVLILIVLLLSALKWMVKGFMIGTIKGNSVRVTAKQYPSIFEIVSEQARELQLSEVPEIYIQVGFFNAFVMKFARTKVLMLYSEVVETALKGDNDILRFIIGHELGHIKRKHLTKDKWLLFSNVIPFLGKAYSRGCEFTCDRIGYHFSRKGAIEGILILSTGREIYSKINIDQFVDEAVNSGSFWMWLSEKFATHPHVARRLDEVKKYAQYH